MKLSHNYSRFNFTDDETKSQYDVICKSAKRGDNVFRIYKNGLLIGTHHPMGGGVNKTQAMYFLKQLLAK